MSSIKYRPEIDGLRALAVIPVILFHINKNWLPGGYLGVDVFFVISGYLITSILLKEMREERFRFKEFWARRIRRILPAMLAVTFATLAFALFFSFKQHQFYTGRSAVAALLSIANIYFWREAGDYWGGNAESSPLLHTWSLSVEEQFYFIFPAILWLAWKFRPKSISHLILFLSLCSLFTFMWGVRHQPFATFYLLPTRAWELGTGCLIAAILHTNPIQANSKPHTALSLAGIGLILASYVFVSDLSDGVMLAVIGTGLIIACGQSGTCKQLLSLRPVVHIGKISYSLYLWHWPVIVFAHEFDLQVQSPLTIIILIAIIYLLSYLSYILIEQPFRKKKGIIPLIGLVYLLLMSASITIGTQIRTHDTSAFNKPAYYGTVYNLNPSKESPIALKLITRSLEWPQQNHEPDAYYNGGMIVGNKQGDPDIVVLGDSHGTMWSETFHSYSKENETKISLWCMGGEPPFINFPIKNGKSTRKLNSDQKYKFDSARASYIEKWKPKLTVLIFRWDVPYANMDNITETIDFLLKHSDRVLLLGPTPVVDEFGDYSVIEYLAYMGVEPRLGKKFYLPMDPKPPTVNIDYILGKYGDRVAFVPVHQFYAKDDTVMVLDGKDVVYADDDHLTVYGTRLATPLIHEKIYDLLK